MDPDRHLSTMHGLAKANCVHINPNFKNKFQNSQNVLQGRTLPHINPKFKNSLLNSEIYNHLQSNIYANSEQKLTSKIHFNPKMIANMTKNVEEQKNDSSSVPMVTQPINKFSKVNPPKEKTDVIPSTSQLNNQPKLSTLVPRKPNRTLVRKIERPKTNPVLLYTECEDKFHTRTVNNLTVANKKSIKQCNVLRVKMSQLKKINITQVRPKLNVSFGLNSSSVFIDGEKFIVCENSLNRISQRSSTSKSFNKITRRICVKGKAFVRRTNNSFVLESKEKPSRRILKKINVSCPIYRRLGVCVRYQKGKCSLLHDPKYIAICRMFLQGDCQIDGCHLSHNVSLEKMPACKYFLNGCCSKTNCPYLHVKMNDNVDICNRFLQGFCDAGKDCNNLHVNVCPNFYKAGKCDKLKCPYPHKNFIFKKVSPIVYSKSKDSEQTTTTKSNDVQNNCTEVVSRYYSDIERIDDKSGENVDKEVPSVDEKNSAVAFNDRPKIGNLPSYIAI